MFYGTTNRESLSKFKEIENANENDFNRMVSYSRRIILKFLDIIGRKGYQMQSQALHYIFEHRSEFL